MTCWTKEALEKMLEDVVNERYLSEPLVENDCVLGASPAELIRLVLHYKDKDMKIRALINILKFLTNEYNKA